MFGTMFTMSMMALEAQQVIWLRTLRMAAGGPAAKHEATLMVTEKVTAAFVAMTQLATGSSHQFVLQGYRSKVQANAKRLSR